MKQNILVIGNGFDLYHGLPTRYKNFLQLVKERRMVHNISPEANNLSDIVIGKQFLSDKPELFIPYEKCSKEKVQQFDKIIYNNFFINYFIETDYQKENWIDFENEIETLLCHIDDGFDSKTIHPLSIIQIFKEYGRIIIGEKSYFKDEDGLLNYLKHELEELIKALDIYFEEFIDKSPINIFSTQIKEMNPQYIINFNYTNTYNKIYKNNNSNHIVDTHHIHGAFGKSNMVLGIKDDKLKDIRYVYFKKYFQRIQKMTGLKYKKWINSKNTNDTKMFRIIGHSVDETDGDIFKDIINSNLTDNIYFYYHSQEAYEHQVINLIKILGKDEFLKLLYSRKIVFLKLNSGKPITDTK